jgi:hypothetical protein
MFVIGGIKIAKTIIRPKLDVVILVILIISLFTVSHILITISVEFHLQFIMMQIPMKG